MSSDFSKINTLKLVWYPLPGFESVDEKELEQLHAARKFIPIASYLTPAKTDAPSKIRSDDCTSEAPLIKTKFYGEGVEMFGFKKDGFSTAQYLSAMFGIMPTGETRSQDFSEFEKVVEKKNGDEARKPLYGIEVANGVPKSVSVQVLALKDERLLKLVEQANLYAMDRLIKKLQVKVTNDGRRGAKNRQLLVPARGVVFTPHFHTISRSRVMTEEEKARSGLTEQDVKDGAQRDAKELVGLDMDLHIHNGIFSTVTVDGPKGFDKDGNRKLLSIDPGSAMEAQKETNADFLFELNRLMTEAGYKTYPTKDAFELVGYERGLIEQFSDGRMAIEKFLEENPEFVERYGPQSATAANYKQRESKEFNNIAMEDRDTWWRHKAAVRGIDFNVLRHQVDSAQAEYGKDSIDSPDSDSDESGLFVSSARDAVKMAVEHLTTNESRFTRPDIIKFAVIEAGELRFSVDEVHQAIDELIAEDYLLEAPMRNGRSLLTTRERADTDELIYKNFRAGIGARKPAATPELVEKTILEFELAKGFSLTKGQREMVEECALTRNMVSVIIGDSGTGKTTGAEVFVRLNRVLGHKTYGLAPLNGAVSALELAGVDAITSQKAILTRKWWERNIVKHKTSIIFDEAGLKDAAGFALVQAFAAEFGAQLVIVGDDKQFTPVGAGAPFVQVVKESEKLGTTVRLTEMRRAKTDKLVQAHIESRDAPMKGLMNMYANSTVTSIRDPGKRIEHIANSMYQMTDTQREKSLVVTGLNADRKRINLEIRKKLGIGGVTSTRAPGMSGHLVNAFEDYGYTKTQKKMAKYYEVGSIVRSVVKTSRMKKGEACEVVSVNFLTGAVKMRRLDGEVESGKGAEFQFYPVMDGEKVQIGESGPMAVARRDLVKFTAEFKVGDSKIKNGTRAVVEHVDSIGNLMTIRSLPDNSRITIPISESMPLTYGWAMSTHSTQGFTMPKGGKLFVHLKRDDATLNFNSLYVGITRSTFDCEVITDSVKAQDIIALGAKVSRASEIDLALEDIKPISFQAPNAIWDGRKSKGIDFVSEEKGGTVANQLLDAVNRFGHTKFAVSGSKEYIDEVVRTAIEMKLDVVWDDPKSHAVAAKVAKEMAAAAEKAKEATRQARAVAEAAAKTVEVVRKPASVLKFSANSKAMTDEVEACMQAFEQIPATLAETSFCDPLSVDAASVELCGSVEVPETSEEEKCLARTLEPIGVARRRLGSR